MWDAGAACAVQRVAARDGERSFGRGDPSIDGDADEQGYEPEIHGDDGCERYLHVQRTGAGELQHDGGARWLPDQGAGAGADHAGAGEHDRRADGGGGRDADGDGDIADARAADGYGDAERDDQQQPDSAHAVVQPRCFPAGAIDAGGVRRCVTGSERRSVYAAGEPGAGGHAGGRGRHLLDGERAADSDDGGTVRDERDQHRRHQHDQRGVGRDVGDHAERRLSGRHARGCEQLRRGKWAVQRRADRGDDEGRNEPDPRERVFQGVAAGAERVPAVERHGVESRADRDDGCGAGGVARRESRQLAIQPVRRRPGRSVLEGQAVLVFQL